jgi:phage-related protein
MAFAKIKWYSKDAMMRWTVETLDERVDAELTALPVDMRDCFVRIAGLLEAFGPMQVREPYVKPLIGKLWEMRLKGKDGIARAAYVAAVGWRLVVVHVFIKKTQKTPRANLDIALGRAKEAGLI